MSDWRALAEQAVRDEASGTIGTIGSEPPLAPAFVPNVPANPRVLLREWHDMLEPLASKRAPAGVDRDWWALAVQDAWWLYENFAGQLVRSRWSGLDLFGTVPGEPHLGGIIARLYGSRNLKIKGKQAIWSCNGRRDWACSGGTDCLAVKGIVLLWDLGR